MAGYKPDRDTGTFSYAAHAVVVAVDPELGHVEIRDYVIVEERPQPDNGQMVVANIDGDATVKRFHREPGGAVRLEPANPAYEPIIVQDRELQIRGVVVGVVRKYH